MDIVEIKILNFSTLAWTAEDASWIESSFFAGNADDAFPLNRSFKKKFRC